MQKFSMFVKKTLKTNIIYVKKYCKVIESFLSHCHCTGEYRGLKHSICNLRYSVLKEIPIVFHNGSNYDYHFLIEELA